LNYPTTKDGWDSGTKFEQNDAVVNYSFKF
jgi:hypothetical protein